ncbi:MAG: tetratricopeptide repeat protein [Pseudomonadota bacterium]
MNRIQSTIRYIPAVLVLCLCADLVHASPGTEAYEAGDFATAEPLLKQELAASDDEKKRILLGIITMSRNEFKEALALFEETSKRYPDSADAQYWVGASAGSLAGNASIFKAAGHAKKARKAFERAIELDPQHLQAHQGLVQYYLQAPGFLGGDKDEALQLAKRSVSFSPIEGRLLVAQVYGQTKQPEQRAAVFEELISAAPDDPRAYLNIGFVQQNEENYEAAHRSFTDAANTSSSADGAEFARQSARYQIGRTAVFSEQRLKDGIEALTDYLDGEVGSGMPDKAWAQFRRGQLHLLASNNDDAQADFAAAKSASTDKRLDKELKKVMR